MAKLFAQPKSSQSAADVETTVVLMRKVGPERFEVVTGVVRGPLSHVKVLESSVSLVVGRGTARKAIELQKAKALMSLGLSGEN